MYQRTICAAAIALAAGSAHADFVASDGKNTIRLATVPCELDLPTRDVMLAASAVIDGKDWKACWAPVSRDAIAVIFEDGDQLMLPVSILRRAPEA